MQIKINLISIKNSFKRLNDLETYHIKLYQRIEFINIYYYMKKVLILGSSGLLGRHIYEKLKKKIKKKFDYSIRD